MLKMIHGYFKYNSSSGGNTARNAFAAVLDTELAKDNVLLSVAYNDGSSKSNDNTTKELVFTLFYQSHNSGISDWNSFWSAAQTEKSNSLVLAGSYLQRCDNLHDIHQSSRNLETETKG